MAGGAGSSAFPFASGALEPVPNTDAYWSGPATPTILPPCFFASYIALSAALSRSSGVGPC